MTGLTGTEPASINDPVLKEITDRLVQAYEPERVYLFGSKARDEDHGDSDYDIMVIVTDDSPSDRQRSRLAYECLWGVRAAADVLVWTRKAFDQKSHLNSSLSSHTIGGPSMSFISYSKSWLLFFHLTCTTLAGANVSMILVSNIPRISFNSFATGTNATNNLLKTSLASFCLVRIIS